MQIGGLPPVVPNLWPLPHVCVQGGGNDFAFTDFKREGDLPELRNLNLGVAPEQSLPAAPEHAPQQREALCPNQSTSGLPPVFTARRL